MFNHKDTIQATSHRSSSEGWRSKSTSGSMNWEVELRTPKTCLRGDKGEWKVIDVNSPMFFRARSGCDRQRQRLREILHYVLKFLKALWNSRGCCHDCSGVAFPRSRYIKLHCEQTDWFATSCFKLHSASQWTCMLLNIHPPTCLWVRFTFQRCFCWNMSDLTAVVFINIC